MAIGTGHRSNNYSESKRNDHLDNNRSNSQSVSINENVFQSFNSYAKAVLGNKSVDMFWANTCTGVLEMLEGGRWVLVGIALWIKPKAVKDFKDLVGLHLHYGLQRFYKKLVVVVEALVYGYVSYRNPTYTCIIAADCILGRPILNRWRSIPSLILWKGRMQRALGVHLREKCV
ncbi:hypothetical protein Tco_1300377 [Tanacetum coccineum]